jgi:hypothetical protein
LLPSGLLLGIAVLGGFVLLCRSCTSRPDPPTAARPFSSQPATTSPPARRPVASASTNRDQLIVAYLNSHRRATGDKIKDALPRESFKVNIYADNGSSLWNRLKIDLDRDEKWDEKWDLENGQPAKRHVATNDDEQYNQEFRWQGGQWVEKTP